MKLLGGLLICAVVAMAAPAWAKGKPPQGKAFMEAYSNLYLVPDENDFIGYQAVVLHVIRDDGEELRILWQQGGGGLFLPQLLTPEKRGDGWVIHVDNSGDWTLHVGKARIDAVSPTGRHEILARVRALD